MADHIIRLETLIQPITDLDEAALDKELEKVLAQLRTQLGKFSKKQDKIDVIELVPDVRPQNLERAMRETALIITNASRTIDQALKKPAKSAQAQIDQANALAAAQKQQAKALESLYTALSRSIAPVGARGAEAFLGIRKQVTGLTAELKKAASESERLAAELKLPDIQKQLSRIPGYKEISEKALGRDFEQDIKERTGVLKDLQRTATVAGAGGVAKEASRDIQQLKELLPLMRQIRDLQAAQLPSRVPTTGLGRDELSALTKADAALKDILDTQKNLTPEVRRTLEERRRSIQAILSESQAAKEGYEVQRQQLRELDAALEKLQRTRAEVQAFGDPSRLGVGSAEADRYLASLRAQQTAAREAAQKAVTAGQPDEAYRKELAQIDSLIDAHRARGEIATAAASEEEEAFNKSRKAAEALQRVLNDLRTARRDTEGVDVRQLEYGTRQANNYISALNRQERILKKAASEQGKYDSQQIASFQRSLEAVQRLQNQFDEVVGKSDKAQAKVRELFNELDRKRKPVSEQVIDGKDLAELETYQREVADLISLLERLHRAPVGRRRGDVEEELNAWRRRNHEVGEAIKRQKELTRNTQTSNQKAVQSLNQLLDKYEQLGSAVSRAYGSKNLETLKEAKRDLQEQAKALAELRRRYYKFGDEGRRSIGQITSGQREVSRQLDLINGEIGRLTGGWGGLTNTVRQFFRYALFYGGMYELLGAITQLGRAIIDLQADLKNIQAVAGATEREMVTISNAVREVALSTRFSAGEISKAATTIAQAGVPPEKIQDVLQSTADFAAAVGGSIETAADLVTTFRDVYDDLSEREIADKLTKAINISKLTSQDLKTIVSISAQTAVDYGLSADQYLAAATTLRNAGIKASTITTGLRQLLIDVFSLNTSALKQLQQLYSEIGETLTEEEIRARFFAFTQSANPLLSALEELERIGVTGRAAGRSGRLFEVRATNVLRALIRNMDELRESEARVTFGGAAAEAAATQMEALRNQLTNTGAAITFFGEELFRGPVEGLAEFFKGLTDTIDKLHELDLTLKSVGDRGLVSDLGLGAASGLLIGSLAPGGLLKKIGVGALGAFGVTASGVGGKLGEEGETAELIGNLAFVVAVLAAVGRFIRTLYNGVKSVFGVGGVQRSLNLGSGGRLSTRIFKVIGNIARVGVRFAGWWGVVGTAVYALYKALSDGEDEVRTFEGEIADLRERERAATQLLHNRLSDAKKLLQAGQDYNPDAGQLGGAVSELQDQVDHQVNLITGIFEGLGTELDIGGVQQVLRQHRGLPGVGQAGTATYRAFIRDITKAFGSNEEQAKEYFKTFSELLSLESQLEAGQRTITEILEQRRDELETTAREDLIGTPLQFLDEAWAEMGSQIENALDGTETDRAQVVETFSRLISGTYERLTANVEETNNQITQAEGEAGELARKTAADLALKLKQRGKAKEYERALDQLLKEQEGFFETEAGLFQSITQTFRNAAGGAEAFTTRTAFPAGGTDFSDIANLPRYRENARKHVEAIDRIAREEGVLPRLLASIVAIESEFKERAIGLPTKHGRAVGLGQVLPSTGADYGADTTVQLLNAEVNLRVASQLLSDLLTSFNGDIELAIAAYHAGERAVKKAGGVPDTAEYITGPDGKRRKATTTRDYVDSVMSLLGAELVANIKANAEGTSIEQDLNAARQRRLKQEEELKAENLRRIRAIRDMVEVERESGDLARIDNLATRKATEARNKLSQLLNVPDKRLNIFVDDLKGIEQALEVYEKAIGELDAKDVQEAAKLRKSHNVQMEKTIEERKIQLDDLKRVGASTKDYQQTLSKIAGLQKAILDNQIADLEKLPQDRQGSKDVEEQIKRLRAKQVNIDKQLTKDIEDYARGRRQADARDLVARQGVATQNAQNAALLAAQQGDFEESNRLVSELTKTKLAELAAEKRRIDTIEDLNRKETGLIKFRSQATGIVSEINDILDRQEEILRTQLQEELEYGVRTQQEVQQLLADQARGIVPSREQALEQERTKLDAIAQVEEQIIASRDLLLKQAKSFNLSQEELVQLKEIEIEAEKKLKELGQERAVIQAASIGLQSDAAQIAEIFTQAADDRVGNLASTIGDELVSGVSGFTSAVVDAVVAGESLDETFRNFFHQFFANIAKAILKALVFKAITEAIGGLGFGLGTNPITAGAGILTTGGLLTPVYNQGGVVKAHSGGVISGRGGIDTNPGVIVHPDGSKSPIMVTHEEAILSREMVKKLGGAAAVQAAIDRFNSTGVARFNQGGVVTSDAISQLADGLGSIEVASPRIDIINVPGTSVVSDYLGSPEGQTSVLNVLERNPMKVRRLIGG